jgi:hypothetical protein
VGIIVEWALVITGTTFLLLVCAGFLALLYLLVINLFGRLKCKKCGGGLEYVGYWDKTGCDFYEKWCCQKCAIHYRV